MEQLSPEEESDLQAAVLQFAGATGNATVPYEFQGAELREIFDEFMLGINFPGAIDVGPIGSKRRAAFTFLSRALEGWRIFQSGLTNQLLIQLLSGEDEDEEFEGDEENPKPPRQF